MIINNLKINGYGKLEDKQIQLTNGINIINGNNESGKSTLLSFIYSMFFGASKNKNGKDISDYDKYKPWNAKDFSGKISYSLDNGKEFEVFRDFSKKNPQIYNENLENISDSFSIDKTKGNQFFVEQTGIDENLFLSTMTVSQDEVVLDNTKQSALIQKITNAVSSGEDNTSYKKTMEKLNKKLIDEVGTNRTSGRPINIVEDEIKTLEVYENDLELYKLKAQNIDGQNDDIEKELKYIQNQISILKEVNEYKQTENLEEQKLEIHMNKLNEYTEKLNKLKNETIKEKTINKKPINPVVLLIICIAIIGGSAIFRNAIMTTALGVILGILFFINYYNFSKYKEITNRNSEEKIKHNKEIELLEECIKQTNEEIKEDRENIEEKQVKEKQYIINKYGNIDAEDYVLQSLEELKAKIEKNQNRYNEIILNKNTFEIEKNNINEKLEDLVKQKERLEYLYEQREELNNLAKYINLAQEGIEEAYGIMKNTITPKFTNELTEIVKSITNGKYKNVQYNDSEGLIVELENGEYTKCNRLSIGTIDQMYLALRLSILNEISKETMPIILDETFVYYDNLRLESILKYINDKYTNRQIIIFSCTNREADAMDRLNIKCNFVNL